MYGVQDQMAEDSKNLHKLDDMVTIAKKALEKIVELTNERKANNKDYIQSIALAALLKIERKGK